MEPENYDLAVLYGEELEEEVEVGGEIEDKEGYFSETSKEDQQDSSDDEELDTDDENAVYYTIHDEDEDDRQQGDDEPAHAHWLYLHRTGDIARAVADYEVEDTTPVVEWAIEMGEDESWEYEDSEDEAEAEAKAEEGPSHETTSTAYVPGVVYVVDDHHWRSHMQARACYLEMIHGPGYVDPDPPQRIPYPADGPPTIRLVGFS